MGVIKNLVGQKFGRLTVVSMANDRDHAGNIKWNCVCDCGNLHTVTGDCLREGKTKSCGCLKREYVEKNKFKKNPNREEAILKVQYNHLIGRHNKKSSEEVIDFKTFCQLSKSKCHYCGLEFSKSIEDRTSESKTKRKISDTVLKINGIDRLDSSKGYTKDNVVPCCKYCNNAKAEMTKNQFLEWIKKVYDFNKEII